MKTPRRMWVNQPSTFQPLHHLHGTRVLVVDEYPGTVYICFLSGPVHGQQADPLWLSNGWPKRNPLRCADPQCTIETGACHCMGEH